MVREKDQQGVYAREWKNGSLDREQGELRAWRGDKGEKGEESKESKGVGR